jgi:hypothetical protein
MGVVPVPLDWAANAGNSPTAAAWQAGVGDPLKFLLDPPRVAVRNTGAQSIPTGAFTALTFNTEDYDNETPTSMHSLITNLSRLTAQTTGTYLVGGLCTFTGNATGRRGLRWRVNAGVNPVPGSQVIIAAGTAANVSVQARVMYVPLAVGDFLELEAFQDSGAALNTVVAGAESQPSAEARWIGP